MSNNNFSLLITKSMFLLFVACLLLGRISCAQLTISTPVGTSISSDSIWDGNIEMTLTLDGYVFALGNFPSTPNNQAFAGSIFEATGVAQDRGFQYYKSTIIPWMPISSNINEARILRITLNPCPGFVVTQNHVVRVSLASLVQDGSSSVSDLTRTFTISATGNKGQMGFQTIAGSNEFEVRTGGIEILVSIKYNIFSTSASFVVAMPGVASGAWSTVLNTARTQATVRLPAQPQFNISAQQDITVTVGTSQTLVPLDSDRVFRATIDPVDRIPRTFCGSNVTTVTEVSLLTSSLTLAVFLADTIDSFDTTITGFNSLFVSGIRLPENVNISVISATSRRVELLVNSLPLFDINRDASIIFTTLPQLLISKECGCGTFAVVITPSPGKIVGTSAMTIEETAVNEGAVEFTFNISKDVFVAGAPVTLESVSGTGPQPAGETFLALVGQSCSVQVGGDATVAVVRCPISPQYNLLMGSSERVRVVFDASAVSSGVAPQMENNVITINGVQPSFNVSFNNKWNDTISIENLWDVSLNYIWFNIRGARWASTAADRWGYRHPLFYSSTIFAQPLLAGGVVDFSRISFSADQRTAKIPIIPQSDAAIAVNERVFVTQTDILSEEPTTSMSNNFASFQILKADSSSIRGNFSGVAHNLNALNPTLISESDVRLGITFSVQLSNSIFGNITSVVPLFEAPGSLRTFGALGKMTIFAGRTNITVKIDALPEYDISVPDVILLRVPDAFFAFQLIPKFPIEGRINIVNLVGPTCTVTSESLSEVNIRTNTSLTFFVRATMPFKANLISTLNAPGGGVPFVTNFPAQSPIRIRALSLEEDSKLLRLQIQPNASYDIQETDWLNFTLQRFFFEQLEGCGTIPLRVSVQVGTVRMNFPPTIRESALRNASLVGRIIVENEAVSVSSFLIRVTVSKSSLTGFAVLIPQNMSANRSTLVNEFVFTFPAMPLLDLNEAELVTVEVADIRVFASGQQPIYENNTFLITPVSERLEAIIPVEVPESVITTGGQRILFSTAFDTFVPSPILNFSASTMSGIPVSVAALSAAFAPGSISVSGRSMNVSLRAAPDFDATENITITLVIPSSAMSSGVAPNPNTFSFVIISQTPFLRFNNSGVIGGSRDLILGNLELHVELVNNRYSSVAGSSVCPSTIECQVSMDTHKRVLTIRLSAPGTFVPSAALTSFTFVFLPEMTLGNQPLLNGNITVSVRSEGGSLEAVPEFSASPKFDESTFRLGLLPSFTLSVTGDRFIEDTRILAEAIGEGIRCTPRYDEYDFCGRFRNLVAGVTIIPGSQRVTVKLQQDEDFDVNNTQSVTIMVSGRGFLSKQAPLPRSPIEFKIQASPGFVYFSSSIFSVSAAFLQDTSRTLDVPLVFTLYGERWTQDPTTDLVNAIVVSPASQAHGFSVLRHRVFLQASISANQRALTLRMTPSSEYQIINAETLSMRVSAECVQSRLSPLLTSIHNTLLITVSGGALRLVSSRTVSAALMKTLGTEIRIESNVAWDSLIVTATAVQNGLVSSASSIAQEPHGYSRYAEDMRTMLVEPVAPGSFSLRLHVPGHSAYSLLAPEDIIVTIPPRFGVNKQAFTPESLVVTIVPDTLPLLIIYRSSVTSEALVVSLAFALGVPSERLTLKTVPTSFGDSGGLFNRVIVEVAPGSPYDSQPSSEIAVRLHAMERSAHKECCNVSAIYWASAEPSRAQINIDIGLAAAPEVIDRSTSLLWVWIALGLLALFAGVGIILWKRFGSEMDSGRNRVAATEPDINFSTLHFQPAGTSISDQLLPHHSVALLGVEGDEFEGPSLAQISGDHGRSTGQKVTFDIDASLHAGQPDFAFSSRRNYSR